MLLDILKRLIGQAPDTQISAQEILESQDQDTGVDIGELTEALKGLPPQEQINLFYSAYNQKNLHAFDTILKTVEIPGENLTALFYEACTHNVQDIAERLVQNPNTNVNWVNTSNYHLTPAIRAAMNDQSLGAEKRHDYNAIIQMILNRPDFDPNVVSQSSDTALPLTVVTQAFGYVPKDSIPTPNRPWKQQLLNDMRINWDQHASYIPLKAESDRRIQKLHEAWQESEPARQALSRQVSTIRGLLGLREPGLFD